MNDDTTKPSGRFVLRVGRDLHGALRDAASVAGVSLNEHCMRRLAAASDRLSPLADGALRHARAFLNDDLVGLAVYGSWARREAGEGSDVDLLLIVSDRVAITRDLYRRWDDDPQRWEGYPIEPHFVQLPGNGAPLTALWAEVSIDGIVLFDPALTVSRALVSIRRRVLEGELVRRTVLGQPYWTAA
jgi:hypothetical protein